MKSIGLIAAMRDESAALLRYIQGSKRVSTGRLDCKSFELYGNNCLLVTSGMGTRRASQATRALIEMFAPELLISFGIAGAVEADLEIGDVVISETYCTLTGGMPGPLQSLSRWPDQAIKAAAFSMYERKARLFTGTAITTGGAQVSENLLRELQHPVLEMETAGIAQVAAEKGIPVLSIRAISDGPRAPIPFDLGMMVDENDNLKIGRILMHLARHPGIIPKLSDLMRNSRLAADNAAYAVVNALGIPNF